MGKKKKKIEIQAARIRVLEAEKEALLRRLDDLFRQIDDLEEDNRELRNRRYYPYPEIGDRPPPAPEGGWVVVCVSGSVPK